MEDRLVQVIKGRHLLTWKDGEDFGVGVGEYKLIFQHGNEIVIMSELDEDGITDQTVEEFMQSYDKGGGYRPHANYISWDEYKMFMNGMENIYREGVHEAFKNVIHSMAKTGVTIHKDIRRELEEIYTDIKRILETKDPTT